MDKKFFWGAATSAHQVEGNNRNDWRAWEIKNAGSLAQAAKRRNWPDYILKNHPSPIEEENYISGLASDHYNRFAEDFDITKNLGHNAHRFSLEWSRLEPEESRWNEKEIEHYRSVISALRLRGMEPFVTLWHFTLPLWLVRKGGALNEKFPEYFARYAEKIAREFGPEVNYWITINEPEIFSLNAYLRGIWPPQRKSIFLFYKAIARLISAHGRAYKTIKSANHCSRVGLAVNISCFQSSGGPLNDLLKLLADRTWNFHFLHHARGSLDFIGLNYYFHNLINYGFNKNKNGDVSDLGWEIYPEGIYHALRGLRKYNLPVYVTENGLADSLDTLRAEFIRGHTSWMKKAVAGGVDVRGYFHWSLLDNFEWDKGFWPRFGLVEVNYETLTRKIRPSALIYKKIIEKSGLI